MITYIRTYHKAIFLELQAELNKQKAHRQEKLWKINTSKKDKGTILVFVHAKFVTRGRMKEKMVEALADIVTMENLSFTKVQKYSQKETPIHCMS